jgi:hypothetical protein
MRQFVIALCVFAASCAGGAPGSPTSPSTSAAPDSLASPQSSLAASQTPSQGPTELPFHGSLEATEEDVFQPPSTVVVHITATGTATHLGKYTLRMNGVVDTITMMSGVGDFTFVAANGDTIVGTSIGQARPGPTPGTLSITEHLEITGGTGRFVSASGSVVVDRVFNQTTERSSGSFAGTISLGH